MYVDIKEQIANPSLRHIEAKKYYVYRHYCINDYGREETFYVGKGQGFRGMSEHSRNELWNKKVSELNGAYYIDIVKYFDNEKDALAFEKELIAYYILFEFGCKCNKQCTDVKDSSLFGSIHKQLFDNAMKNGDSMTNIVHLYFSVDPAVIDNTDRLYDTFIKLRDKLVDINSEYSITSNPSRKVRDLSDINFYAYKPIEEDFKIIEELFDNHYNLNEIIDYFKKLYLDYSNTKLCDIVNRFNKMLCNRGINYEILYDETESEEYSIAYEGYYYIHKDDFNCGLSDEDELELEDDYYNYDDGDINESKNKVIAC